jgi:hypothetical protein
VEHFAGLTTALDTQRGTREPIERRSGVGQEIRPSSRRHGVTAGAQEKASAEPIFEQAYLPAYRAMSDVELFRRAGEAAESCGSLEGFDRIQRR